MARLLVLAVVVAALIGGIYAWKHRATIDNPGIHPGINVVTINPLPS